MASSRKRPSARRTAVALSGGVDSVSLLHRFRDRPGVFALHVHHGRDDVLGGRARVVVVHRGYQGMDGIWVEVAEHPGDLYNWEELGPRQAALRREFGQQRARPIPDLRPEFNED